MLVDWPELKVDIAALAPPVHCHVATPAPLRLLMVEDNDEASELIKCYLADEQQEQFDVESYANLIDAMFRLQYPGIDVVLLDLGLPELNGYKTFRAIDGMTNGEIPIVIFTADDRPLSRDLTVSFGAAGYLIKQHTTAIQLRQALREAVARFRSNPKDGRCRHPA
jgi:CheY-like chemotaxis protein